MCLLYLKISGIPVGATVRPRIHAIGFEDGSVTSELELWVLTPYGAWRVLPEDDLEAAAQITMQIVTSVQQLDAFPMSGRAGRVPGTRKLVISNTPFIAAYAIEKARIVILDIYHGTQHWPESF